MNNVVIDTIQDHELDQVLLLIHSEPETVLPRRREELEQNIQNVFVIREEGKPVACAVFENYCRKIAEIRSVVVLPEYRKKGYAAQLIQHICDTCVAPGQEVFVVTSAESFFRKQGFHHVLREKQVLFWQKQKE